MTQDRAKKTVVSPFKDYDELIALGILKVSHRVL